MDEESTKSPFEEYVGRSSRPMVAHIKDPMDLDLLAVSNAMGGECGELQNVVKKILRDGNSDDLEESFIYEAGDLLHYLTRLINSRGYTLHEIQVANIDKLEKRLGLRAC